MPQPLSVLVQCQVSRSLSPLQKSIEEPSDCIVCPKLNEGTTATVLNLPFYLGWMGCHESSFKLTHFVLRNCVEAAKWTNLNLDIYRYSSNIQGKCRELCMPDAYHLGQHFLFSRITARSWPYRLKWPTRYSPLHAIFSLPFRHSMSELPL